MPNPNSLWLNYLEKEPQAPYYAALYGQKLTPNQRRWGQGAFNDIYGQYQGALGQQILSGQEPTLRWTDYLAKMPFTERYANLPMEFRGEFPQRFAPRTRWITAY